MSNISSNICYVMVSVDICGSVSNILMSRNMGKVLCKKRMIVLISI